MNGKKQNIDASAKFAQRVGLDGCWSARMLKEINPIFAEAKTGVTES